jgi:hypothetical protein
MGGLGGGRGHGREMAQTMYAHMNKWINKQKKEDEAEYIIQRRVSEYIIQCKITFLSHVSRDSNI